MRTLGGVREGYGRGTEEALKGYEHTGREVSKEGQMEGRKRLGEREDEARTRWWKW